MKYNQIKKCLEVWSSWEREDASLRSVKWRAECICCESFGNDSSFFCLLRRVSKMALSYRFMFYIR